MMATENGSALQVMLHGEDSEKCPAMGVHAGQTSSQQASTRTTDAAHIRWQGRTAELADVQPTSMADKQETALQQQC